MPEKQPAVYIMASARNGTVYVGVTADLVRRVGQHRTSEGHGFAARYGCTRLVFYELHSSMEAAIGREKQLKAGPRRQKVALIEETNPQWLDLYNRIL